MVSVARKRSRNMTFSWKSTVQILMLLAVLLFLLIGLPKLKNADFFPIKDVKVFGVEHLNHDEVQNLVLPFVNRGFFLVDVERIKERIMQLSWVSQVVVQRVWPNRVMITITEKKPFALWNDTSLLSDAGDLFSPPVESYPTGLPQFVGPTGEQILMLENYAKMSSLLMPLHFKISRLELTPTLAWMITLDNGIKINVGHKDILTRLSHFVKVYPKIFEARVAALEYIDLRYSNGMAVRWKK